MVVGNYDMGAIIRATPLQVDSSGVLNVAGLSAAELLEEYGSPLFVFHEGTIIDRAASFVNALADDDVQTDVFFAMKSNGNLAVLESIRKVIKGIDTTSLGEMTIALAAGFQHKDMILHGNAKSVEEIEYAIGNDVGLIVADSIDELAAIDRLAKEQNKVCKVGIRITLDLKSHSVWNTSTKKSKFGVFTQELLSTASGIARLKNVRLTCVHTHIGSQIIELEVYLEAVRQMVHIAGDLLELGVTIENINIGGGFPVRYKFRQGEDNDDMFTVNVDIGSWLKEIVQTYKISLRSAHLERLPTLSIEPGRSIVADAGVLLARVESVKRRSEYDIIGLDAGCNTLTDCWTYDWYFECVPITTDMEQTGTRDSMVVGPLCDSGDVLLQHCKLPPPKAGDIVAFLQIGAYQFEQQTNFNLRPRAAAVMISNGKARVVSDRYVVSE